jgi:hypothetical protein
MASSSLYLIYALCEGGSGETSLVVGGWQGITRVWLRSSNPWLPFI